MGSQRKQVVYRWLSGTYPEQATKLFALYSVESHLGIITHSLKRNLDILAVPWLRCDHRASLVLINWVSLIYIDVVLSPARGCMHFESPRY